MNAIKYPRTYHLPFSEGRSSDDKILKSYDNFIGQEIVITEKLDGENTSLYNDVMHARSMDSQHNFTRDWVKRLHSFIKNDIPTGYRLCGENMSYYHSIEYNNLEGFFYLLSVWNDNNECLSWAETVTWASLLDLPQPKVLYQGVFDLHIIENIANNVDTSISEGFVGRVVDTFKYKDFSSKLFKWVRPKHVNDGSKHWLKTTYPNKLTYNICKPLIMK